jgi:hypothetical protein
MFDDIYMYCNCYKKIDRPVTFECFDTIEKANLNKKNINGKTKTLEIFKHMPYYLKYFTVKRQF